LVKRPLHIIAKRNGKRADVRIEGEIASYQKSNARDFEAAIDALVASGVSDGHVYIDSEGGSHLEAKRIVAALRKLTGRITGEGGAAVMSAATYIGLHLDEFRVQKNTMYMVHKPMVELRGTEDQVESDLKGLKDVTKEYRAAYAKKTGKSEDEIEAIWSKGDRWYTGEEAVAEGFVDGLVEDDEEEDGMDEEAVARIAACGCPANKLPKAHAAISKTTTMDIKALRATLGMPETATEADVLARVTALKTAEVTAKADEAARRAQDIKALLDKAISERKLTEAHRASFTAKFTADFDVTKAEVEALVAAPEVTKEMKEAAATGAAEVTAKGREAWGYDEWATKDEKGLKELMAKSPDKFTALYEGKYGRKPELPKA
jgi:ATP-dependent protease ClpP protease subunit